MSVAELEENEIIEDESVDVEEVDEMVDNDQTEVDEIVSEEENVGDDGEPSEDSDDDVDISYDGVSLTPNDDKEEEGAPQWAKDLRKIQKDTSKENRELKKELEAMKQAQPVAEALQSKARPTREEFDYDDDAYDAAIDEWHVHEAKVKEATQVQEQEQKRQANEWQERLNHHQASVKKLKVKDFSEAQEVVDNRLDDNQRGIIVHASDNSGLSFYAIGKNEELANELANIKDPIKFAYELGKKESKLSTTKRKARTNPESTVKSSGGTKGADRTLERLRAEADKTNDRSKVVAYLTKLRAKNN
jgi:superfamily II DNA helicase RecQ